MIAKVSEKGSVVIPAKVRAKYGITPQSMVQFLNLDGEIVLIPISDDPIGDSRGILSCHLTAREILEEGRKLDRQKEELSSLRSQLERWNIGFLELVPKSPIWRTMGFNKFI